MLSPRLTNCPECANIPSLLKKIDCKLAELGNSLYNNVSYMLNQPIPAGDILQLIGYRRILMHKYCNPNYVHEYSVAMIASRVIRITVGCVSRCNTPEPCLEDPCEIDVVANPTTTSTTTLTSCKSYILYNTATSAESFLIGSCDTGQPETITLQGLSSVCISTIVALNVSPNIVVIDTDECTTTTTTTAVPTTTTSTTVQPTTTTTSSSSSTSTTTSSSTSTTTTSTSSSTTTTTTTILPTTTTTSSSSTSTSTSTTTSTTTLTPTTTTTSSSTSTTTSSTSTSTSTSTTTSTTTIAPTTTTTTTPLDCTFTGTAEEIIPIFGIGNILGTSTSSPFFRIYDDTLVQISQLPSVGVTPSYGINASDNYQYSIAAAGGGAPLQVKVSNNYGNSYSTPIGIGSGYTRETLISKNGEYMYVESGSTLLRSDNSGTSFSSVSLPVTFTIFIQSSISWDGQYVIVAGNNSTVFSILLSTDYGITFTNITLNIFPSQSAANSSIGQCAAVSGNGQYMMVMAGIGTNNSYRSTDFGVTWTIMSIVSQDFNEDLKLSYDGRYGIVGATNNRVITTNDFGVTWTTNTFASNIYKTGISNSGQYMLAELSGIFQTRISSNYGATWTSYPAGTKRYLSFIN